MLASLQIGYHGSVTMDDIKSIHLRHLHGRLGDVVYQMTKVQFSDSAHRTGGNRRSTPIDVRSALPSVWISPEWNGGASRCRWSRGGCGSADYRQAPEPDHAANKPVQILLMEIDYGPFERELILPQEVDPERVTAEQQQGLLWVYLKLRSHS